MKPENNPTKVRKRKVLRKLIHAYRDMPHLWDKKNKNYHNKQLRNDDYRKLAVIYQEAESDASIYTVRRKIDNLRNVYMRELKKVKACQMTATDPEDLYEPSVWHYKEMSFLEDVMEPQTGLPGLPGLPGGPGEGAKDEANATIEIKIEDPLDSDSNDHFANEDLEDMEDEVETSSHTIAYTHIHPSTSLPKERTSDNDADDIVGKFIGVQLKDVQKRQKVIALKLISDAIYFANLGKLRETSFIQLQ